MNIVDMLSFLVEHDIDLHCSDTHKIMSADCLYELGEGEFTVYYHGEEIFRGNDFYLSLSYLENREEKCK